MGALPVAVRPPAIDRSLLPVVIRVMPLLLLLRPELTVMPVLLVTDSLLVTAVMAPSELISLPLVPLKSNPPLTLPASS